MNNGQRIIKTPTYLLFFDFYLILHLGIILFYITGKSKFMLYDFSVHYEYVVMQF